LLVSDGQIIFFEANGEEAGTLSELTDKILIRQKFRLKI
jgi:hypothetical protein